MREQLKLFLVDFLHGLWEEWPWLLLLVPLFWCIVMLVLYLPREAT